ncbi:hypothetical protein [Polyangium jinanense]|uniref:Uncharacterized protein n=1 Tax=Polyangium jinanense TaxID=2829994 RepID=A0A9X3X3K5_9BACT|nr:hypothetical protein [Polyangium jinanense]MDC3955342.1 hypothetical protein [Polyangium jinanense]MDC3981643.1 hypothetical protein [Polyangium jinanense]
MKAPEDRLEDLDGALRRALATLATHPWKNRVDDVARAVAATDVGLRVIIAAQLTANLWHSRQYDEDEAYREVQDTYEGAVSSAASVARELLAYEEVEGYMLAHPASREVQELLSYKEATDRMRASVMRQCRTTR